MAHDTDAARATARERALARAQQDFAVRHPRTMALHARAARSMPGGNTRTVLFHRPAPLCVASGHDALLTDVDGFEYVDLLGDYSSGLFGHSHPVIARALTEALAGGVSLGAQTEAEARHAEAVCARFGLDRVRFTNSGTEANLMALTAVRAFTGREKIVVFRGGYHGGVLNFHQGAAPSNAPYDVLVARYNDAAGVRALFAENPGAVAAVLVEPMLGSGGCVPGEPEFLAALREVTREHGALLVFDEVMTSRTGRAGLQGELGIRPDLTTLGKYLGGGSSFGAFGGRADVMALFDPRSPGALEHPGTFNNNVLSMTAGHAGLTRVYAPEVAEAHTRRGDEVRHRLTERLAGGPVSVSGVGSLMAVHVDRKAGPAALELVFLGLLDRGYYIAPRGFAALSLAVTDVQLDGFAAALGEVADTLV